MNRYSTSLFSIDSYLPLESLLQGTGHRRFTFWGLFFISVFGMRFVMGFLQRKSGGF